MSEADVIQIRLAQEIRPDSWLRTDPHWRWLADGLDYAATQTFAIPALSKCTPEEIAQVVVSVMRGARIALPNELGAASSAQEPNE